MRRRASSTAAPSLEPMVTVPTTPSSSTAMSAPVSCCRALMTLPLGPMTSPILSIGISKLVILGAVPCTSGRGSAMAPFMTSRILRRASLACCSAWASTSAGRPSIFVSSCSAVTTSAVPATLKSMSPNASSEPRMSVSAMYVPLSKMRPMAMPATCSRIGTPASLSDSDDAHTEPVDDALADELLGERADRLAELLLATGELLADGGADLGLHRVVGGVALGLVGDGVRRRHLVAELRHRLEDVVAVVGGRLEGDGGL